jgi:hypothetical protein
MTDLPARLGFTRGIRAHDEQIVEQRPVVDHRLAKVLCRTATGPLLVRDPVCRAVVLDRRGVVHRQQLDLLGEPTRRVALLVHHHGEQGVRLAQRARRVVDELRLHCLPALRQLVAAQRRQRPDLQLLDAPGAIDQRALRDSRAGLLDRSVILRPEAGPQLEAAFAPHEIYRGADRHADPDDDDQQDHLVHGGFSLWIASAARSVPMSPASEDLCPRPLRRRVGPRRRRAYRQAPVRERTAGACSARITARS